MDAVQKGISHDITWDYDYMSLWSPKLKDTRGHKVNIFSCSPETFVSVLATRTHWFKRLPKSGKNRVKVLSRTRKGRLHLKDILNTADGVLVSLIFSMPELFLEGGYKTSDRIANSVIMNCFHNYSLFQKRLKLIRKTIKYHSINSTKVPLIQDIRSLSYFQGAVDKLNRMCTTTSKEKIFRLACLTQTRSTGLCGVGQMKEALDEFLDIVTKKEEYKPDKLLERCIEEVTDFIANQSSYGLVSNFRISMSTSACTEQRKSEEGKFGFLKKIVRENGVVIPPLTDGIPGTLGNWLWPISMMYIETAPEQALKVNVVAIRENGKARIVTTGSFWKEIALQPLSHLTIETLKCVPNLKDGLKAARLGWKFMEDVEYWGKPQDKWIFSGDPFAYSTDWKYSTDGPTPESGWALTGTLLKKLRFPEEYLDRVRRYWLGEKRLHVNGEFVGLLVRGIPMGDPLTKTNLSLAHPVCDLYARYKTASLAKEKGQGDDTMAFVQLPEYAVEHARCAEMLGYVRSPLDEALTRRWGTFCEEWLSIPLGPWNTVRWAMRAGNIDLLPFLDVPKLRCLIATEKDRKDFSTDPRGKVTLIGHEMDYVNRLKNGPGRTVFSIASAFQDLSLATIDSPVPLFLPRQVNGVGKAPPNWDVNSWMEVMKRCPKWHREYYLQCMRDYNEGTCVINRYKGALKSQNHFDKELLLEYRGIPEDDIVKTNIYVPMEKWKLFPGNVLTKLIRTGYLIPESKLISYYLFQERLESLEQDTRRDLFEVIRSKMVNVDFSESSAREIVEKFSKTFKDRPWDLRNSVPEDLYCIDALGDMKQGDPREVTFREWAHDDKFFKIPRPGSQYEIDAMNLYKWFLVNRELILEGKRFKPPPHEIIEDDPIILLEIQWDEREVHLIVTDDVKMVRLAINRTRKIVGRIPVMDYFSAVGYEGEDLSITRWEEEFSRVLGKSVCFHLDTGSLDSRMVMMDRTRSGEIRQCLGVPWDQDLSRKNIRFGPPLNERSRGLDGWIKSKSMREMGYPRRALYRDYPGLFS